uniref:Putative secreted protein n=1 Tax=Anopheles marajoara TaxID=58244 RepID=A0A2M4C857_9DIPT
MLAASLFLIFLNLSFCFFFCPFTGDELMVSDTLLGDLELSSTFGIVSDSAFAPVTNDFASSVGSTCSTCSDRASWLHSAGRSTVRLISARNDSSLAFIRTISSAVGS